jgi:hypothetical protein
MGMQEAVQSIADKILNYVHGPVQVKVFNHDLHILIGDRQIIHYGLPWHWDKIKRDIDAQFGECNICYTAADEMVTCEQCSQSHCVKCYIQSWTAANCPRCPWCRATAGEPTDPWVTAAEQAAWLERNKNEFRPA